jgi:cytochrome oxidase assembly protein ShyY1
MIVFVASRENTFVQKLYRYFTKSLVPLIRGSFLAFVLITLIALGVWQTGRAQEKIALDRADRQYTDKPPTVIDDNVSSILKISKKDMRFSPIQISGVFNHTKEQFFFVTHPTLGAGYRVITPFKRHTDPYNDTEHILVDRGFVPVQQANGETSQIVFAPLQKFMRPENTVSVTGTLSWSDKRDERFFIPEPDLKNHIWYSKDIASIAAIVGTIPVILTVSPLQNSPPLETTSQTLVYPLAMMPAERIPASRHISYAFTWFFLALAWFYISWFHLRKSITR